MYRNLYLAKIASYGDDGYPVLDSKGFFKLYETGANNVSITSTYDTQTTENNADDTTETSDEVISGISGSFTALGISAEAKASIFGMTTDKSGNLITKGNTGDARFVLTYQYKDKKGKSVQRTIYKVNIVKNRTENSNQAASDQDITISFKGEAITDKNGDLVYDAFVYEGNAGWVNTKPTAVYKEATA